MNHSRRRPFPRLAPPCLARPCRGSGEPDARARTHSHGQATKATPLLALAGPSPIRSIGVSCCRRGCRPFCRALLALAPRLATVAAPAARAPPWLRRAGAACTRALGPKVGPLPFHAAGGRAATLERCRHRRVVIAPSPRPCQDVAFAAWRARHGHARTHTHDLHRIWRTPHGIPERLTSGTKVSAAAGKEEKKSKKEEKNWARFGPSAQKKKEAQEVFRPVSCFPISFSFAQR